MTRAFNTSSYASVDICYYAAFAIYSFFHLMESTNYQTIFGVEMNIASTVATALMLVLLIPRLIVERHTWRSLCIAAIILFTGLMVFLFAHSWICLSVGLFICAGRNIRIDPLLYIMAFAAATVFLFAYGGVKAGIIETFLMSRSGETRVRDSLGFAQVNFVGIIGARICTALVLLRRKQSPWVGAAVCLVLALAIEIVANSRTSEIYIISLALVSLLLWLRKKNGQMLAIRVKKICFALVIGGFLCTATVLLFFNPMNSFWMELSHLLSNRLYSMWYFVQNYPLSFFGNNLLTDVGSSIWTGDSYAMLTIDNAWALWLVGYGFVPTLLLFLGLVYFFRHQSGVASDFALPLLCFALLCSLFAFNESSAFAIDNNPLLITLACVVYGDSVCKMIGTKDDIKKI